MFKPFSLAVLFLVVTNGHQPSCDQKNNVETEQSCERNLDIVIKVPLNIFGSICNVFK